MRPATAAIITALFLLPACTQLEAMRAATSGTISSVAPDSVNTAKRLLTAAHEAHRVTADFLADAANSNLCHRTCAVTAKKYLDQSEAALKAADTAIALGDAPGVEAKIATATALISQINGLMGKK